LWKGSFHGYKSHQTQIGLPASGRYRPTVTRLTFKAWLPYQSIIVSAHHFGSLYDEVINTAQDVLEFASMVQQQNWISSMQNTDCVDDRLHRHCNTL
jgi:hypothetical protein